VVGRGEVELPVAVDVAERHLAGPAFQRRAGRLGESAFAVTQQDDDVAFRAGDNQVRLAVTVDVAGNDVLGLPRNGDDGSRRLERGPRAADRRTSDTQCND